MMDENAMRRWANPEILRWARKQLGLTPEEVEAEARRLRRRYYELVSAEEIRAWERGQGEPTMAQLETLGEIYVCPVGYFFLDTVPEVARPLSFRGLVEHKVERLSSPTRRSLERFMEFAEWTVELIRRTGVSWDVRIRPREVEPRTQDAERLAHDYRVRLGWTVEVRAGLRDAKEAFQWWRRTLEDQGVFCFELPLDPGDIRGASLWYEGYPFILVNHQDAEAATGRLFTLLHEFAHLISARGDGIACDFRGARRGENPEPFANRFAARMLLTPEELKGRLKSVGETRLQEEWPDSVLQRLGKPFFVSRDVVAILLQEMRYAPQDFYERKRAEWESKKPWGRGGRRPPQREQALQRLGYSLSRLLGQAMEKPEFSWADAASMMGMKVEKTEEFLRWVKEQNP